MKVLNRFTPILLFFLSLVSLRVKTEILPPLLSESELSACPVGPGKVPFTVLPPIFFCHVPPQLTVPLGKVVEARSGFSPPLVPGMLTLEGGAHRSHKSAGSGRERERATGLASDSDIEGGKRDCGKKWGM